VDAWFLLDDNALDGMPQERRFEYPPNFRPEAKPEQKPGFRSSSPMIHRQQICRNLLLRHDRQIASR
jgi:hypothetical protein